MSVLHNANTTLPTFLRGIFNNYITPMFDTVQSDLIINSTLWNLIARKKKESAENTYVEDTSGKKPVLSLETMDRTEIPLFKLKTPELPAGYNNKGIRFGDQIVDRQIDIDATAGYFTMADFGDSLSYTTELIRKVKEFRASGQTAKGVDMMMMVTKTFIDQNLFGLQYQMYNGTGGANNQLEGIVSRMLDPTVAYGNIAITNLETLPTVYDFDNIPSGGWFSGQLTASTYYDTLAELTATTGSLISGVPVIIAFLQKLIRAYDHKYNKKPEVIVCGFDIATAMEDAVIAYEAGHNILEGASRTDELIRYGYKSTIKIAGVPVVVDRTTYQSPGNVTGTLLVPPRNIMLLDLSAFEAKAHSDSNFTISEPEPINNVWESFRIKWRATFQTWVTARNRQWLVKLPAALPVVE